MTKPAKTVAQKMRITPGSCSYIEGAPEGVLEQMQLPTLVREDDLSGEFVYMHLFVSTQAQMRDRFGQLKAQLAPHGMLWVSWPKGGRLGTDLNMRSVIAIGYDLGMVESVCLRVDDTWAGLKFTFPKPGKTYRNSYGTLPAQR